MDLIKRIKIDEGLRLRLYRCSSGKLTIGYGRNIEDRGISPDEADFLLSTDIDLARQDAMLFLGDPATWEYLEPVRQDVLVQMSFNMGLTALRTFKFFRKAILAEDWAMAAHQMIDSRWSQQLGSRAVRLAKEMRTGVAVDG